MRLAVLSFRPYQSDFRRVLLSALQDSGGECLHVYLQRRSIEIRRGTEGNATETTRSLSGVARILRRFFGDETGIILNSAGNSGVDVVLRLWMRLRDQLWIYDIYDWLLYDSTGLKRLQWWATDRAYWAIGQGACVLSRDLQPRYPGAFHFDNASHLRPSSRTTATADRIVIAASFDARTDYDLIEAVAEAAPTITIDMFGAVYDKVHAIESRIGRLVRNRPNVRYYGKFRLDDLSEMLAGYTIGFVPYLSRSALTKFINPDKYYHYLCAGLEVVTTSIPQARHLAEHVHLADKASAVVAAIETIAAGSRKNPGNLHERLNWHVRAAEFRQFVLSLKPIGE
jgi:hypothetical protein